MQLWRGSSSACKCGRPSGGSPPVIPAAASCAQHLCACEGAVREGGARLLGGVLGLLVLPEVDHLCQPVEQDDLVPLSDPGACLQGGLELLPRVLAGPEEELSQGADLAPGVHLVHGDSNVLLLPQEAELVLWQRDVVLPLVGEPVNVDGVPVLRHQVSKLILGKLVLGNSCPLLLRQATLCLLVILAESCWALEVLNCLGLNGVGTSNSQSSSLLARGHSTRHQDALQSSLGLAHDLSLGAESVLEVSLKHNLVVVCADQLLCCCCGCQGILIHLHLLILLVKEQGIQGTLNVLKLLLLRCGSLSLWLCSTSEHTPSRAEGLGTAQHGR
mmetsp:Transcript_5259/g.11524  ORF Transcript_5259/g.11524 Transcript_5259/m.11524 type:complete len:330 (+) Transcript_5259:331-1320(+)